MSGAESRRLGCFGLALIAGIGLCVLWPPITVVPLQASNEARDLAAFDPENFARTLWANEFPALADASPNIVDLLRALGEDSVEAARRFGRVWGLGGNTYFVVQGVGQVVAVREDKLEVTLEGADAGPSVVLLTGRLFGNAVRNGSGLVDPSAFPNSQDLNNLSTALNRIVTEEVLSPLRKSAVLGDSIRFVGCAEVRNVGSVSVLEIVPISATVVDEGEG